MSDKNQWLKDLIDDSDLWAESLDSLPAMLSFQYGQLRRFAIDGQVYGIMLQCRDLIESLMKVPVLMALMAADSDPSHLGQQAYRDVINNLLKSTMSMGLWNEEALIIIKNKTDLHVPDTIVNILKKTRSLYSAQMNGESSNVVNWRNNTIGHGALRFEDDPSYQEELKTLLKMLKEYFDGSNKKSIKGLYDNVYFVLDNEKLTGSASFEWKSDSSLKLIADGKEYRTDNYMYSRQLKGYLFETYFSKRQVLKSTSYTDGKSETERNEYFANLYQKFVSQGDRNFDINSDFISRENEKVLEYLNTAPEYVRPEKLIDCLSDTMEETGKGIISIFMERGTGKSAFANQMSGLYHSSPLIADSFSRCVHVQNVTMRGISDFINSVNFGFRHSFNSANDLYGSSDELLSISLETETPKEDMADFLNYYHERYRKLYTILVLDGIDELGDDTERILEYIPSFEQLEAGVFVILLSRFKDENTVLGSSKSYIDTAVKICDRSIEVRRKDECNTEVLNKYIDQQIKAGEISPDTDRDALLAKADYRFLYLKAYFAVNHEVDFDNTDETRFIASYMKHLLSFYGPKQAGEIREFAVCATLFPGLTIRKYCDMISFSTLTCELAGLINDLMPLMSVYRIDNEDVYQFADQAYGEFILKEYAPAVLETVKKLNNALIIFRQTQFEGKDALDLYQNIELSESDIQTLMFYCEGVHNVFRLSLGQLGDDLFAEITGIIDLAEALCFSKQTSHGYGTWLIDTLVDDIAKGLLRSVSEEHSESADRWCKTVCGVMNSNADDIDEAEWVRTFLLGNKHMDSVRNWLIQNSLPTDDISDWFWLFENGATPEAIHLFTASDERMEQLIQWSDSCFFIISFLDVSDQFSLSDNIRRKIESIRLKTLLPSSTSYVSKQEKDRVLNCLNKMEEMGIQPDEESLSKPDRFVLNSIRKPDYNEVIFQRLSSPAIRMLNDIDKPWINKVILLKPLRFIYFAKSDPDFDHSIAFDFYHALYNRLVYEEMHKNLLSLMMPQDFLFSLFPFMLKSVSNEDNIVENFAVWSRIAHKYALLGYTQFARLSANLKIAAIQYLEETGNKDERDSLFEELIMQDEIPAYIASQTEHKYDKDLPTLLAADDSLVFCTANTLALLKEYQQTGNTEKLNRLMDRIETSVPEFLDNYGTDIEKRSDAEVLIFRYMKYSSELRAADSFDQYVNSLLSSHEQAVDALLKDLSRDSRFDILDLHLEVILEYFWRREKLDEGIQKCEQLCKILQADTSAKDDPVVSELIDNEIYKIKCAENFLYFVSGHPYDNTDRRAEWFECLSQTAGRFGTDGIFYNTDDFETCSRQADCSDYLIEDGLELRML